MNEAILTIDFELFTQTPAYRSADGETDQDDIGLEGGRFLRSIIEEYAATATCFVVSSVAEQFPDAVTALADAGYEIGSHTHTHRLLTELDPGARREELARSREILEQVTDRTVEGFRAPAFDVPADHFDALAETGYGYDSSVVASRWIPGWYGGEYDVQRPVPATDVQADAPAGLAELPASVMPGLRLPLTGTWIRFFGPRYTILGMKLLARRGIAPVLYVHPWEFVDLPDVEGVPTRVYYHTGAWMRRAIERILAQPFEFVTAREIVSRVDGVRESESGVASTTAGEQ
jgi:peptidoglycan/xylan/chitin deacetylase (PgdA/CDA1 family)